MIISPKIKQLISESLSEDAVGYNLFYYKQLPKDTVQCEIKIKSDLILAGLPFFFETFKTLNPALNGFDEIIEEFEGKSFSAGKNIAFHLPFDIALTGERLALNYLQHMSSIATFTNKFVEKANKFNIKILDTRKTTPSLRSFEKYAVRVGGGHNHRFNQNDSWMVKDNHKEFFGGVEQALAFFSNVGSMYNSLVLEIHNLKELEQGIELGAKHFMLDNFSPEEVKQAVSIKKEGITYEASGGMTFDTIDNYIIDGLDAISVGSITYAAPHVDISFKYRK